ncbi:hypothetical protein PPACK8108_LOCUS12199, partial [Phakopsora pachyrhizi]
VLKNSLDSIPTLNNDNFPFWKKKKSNYFSLRGIQIHLPDVDHKDILASLNLEASTIVINNFSSSIFQIIASDKNDSNAAQLWLDINNHFASSKAHNTYRVFNKLMYLSLH